MSNRARWDVEGRDWPNRAASRFVEVDNIRWHVQQMGSGPELLLLHGTGAATHSWRDLMPRLAERFWVTACDLPGHGFTQGRPAGGLAMPAMARAVSRLTERLGVDPALIVGHSAGAAIAIRMTLDGLVRPRALVGLNAALLPFPGFAARLFPALAKLLFVNPFAPQLFAGMARRPGEVGRFLVRSTGSHIDDAGVEAYARLFATPAHCAGAITMMADWDLASLAGDLGKLTVPLMLIHGAGDAAIPATDARIAAAKVPVGELEVLPRLGHLAHEEAPDDIGALITRFARDHAILHEGEKAA